MIASALLTDLPSVPSAVTRSTSPEALTRREPLTGAVLVLAAAEPTQPATASRSRPGSTGRPSSSVVTTQDALSAAVAAMTAPSCPFTETSGAMRAFAASAVPRACSVVTAGSTSVSVSASDCPLSERPASAAASATAFVS